MTPRRGCRAGAAGPERWGAAARRPATTALLLLVVSATASGCGSDIGKACPEMSASQVFGTTDDPSDGTEVTRTVTTSAIETSARFDCEHNVCAATPGRAPYCTRPCASDDECPQPFTCRPLSQAEAAVEATYCLWRQCRDVGDCGGGEDYICAPVPDVGAGGAPSYCGPR